ncbi:MAG: hypothetical protein RLZZ501_32 [Pseudomonadota bacterium]
MPSDAETFPATCWPDGIPGQTRVGVVVGMESEAALLPPGLLVGIAGADPVAAEYQARRLLDQGAQALLSFGIAGGLDPTLASGDLIVATGVIEGLDHFPANQVWMCRLLNALPEARRGPVFSANSVIAGHHSKRGLFASVGARAVDMESGAVARVAAGAGCPFAVLRAIADPAGFSLPSAAAAGLGPDGKPRPLAVLGRLALRPWQLPGLIRLGLASRSAHHALAAALAQLGPGFAL